MAVRSGFGVLVFTFTLSLVYTFLSLCIAMIQVFRNGIVNSFRSKMRDVRPSILDDHAYGSHSFARLKRFKLHYVSKGAESKPLMLFLHGFPEFWFSWRHQLKEFGGDFRAVALDMRGYGESDKPLGISNYSMEFLVEDIKELIPALGYEKCVLVAHDWGGAVAFSFARMYPEMVERLIVCNSPSGPSFKKFLSTNMKQFLKSWYMFFFQMPWIPEFVLALNDLKMFEELFANPKITAREGEGIKDVIEAYKYAFSQPGGLRHPVDYYRASFQYNPSLQYPSKKVKVPTMMVWGADDLYLSKELAVLAGNDCENYRYHYVPGASHWVQQEEPEEVNKLMRSFLAEDVEVKEE